MRKDVQKIFTSTPHDKQVMMFSATLSQEIRPVCKKFMSDVCPFSRLASLPHSWTALARPMAAVIAAPYCRLLAGEDVAGQATYGWAVV